VAVHLEWAGGIRINGAACGGFDVQSGVDDPAAIPDWLAVGWTLPLIPEDQETGRAPDQTALYAEGCAEVSPEALIEAWARHTLNWINRWEDDGPRALHAEWRGLAHGMGEEITQSGQTGTFLGVDENFGMLLRVNAETRLIPLSTVLETET